MIPGVEKPPLHQGNALSRARSHHQRYAVSARARIWCLRKEMRPHLIATACAVFLSLSQGSILDLQRLSIDHILDTISRNVSCIEITKFFLDRIDKYDAKIHAIITLDGKGALEQANKLDHCFRVHGNLFGKLHCVPVLIKDNILVEGLPMTLGLGFFANSTCTTDAPAVRLLKDAGAVILGKANMAPMAMSAPEYPSHRGVVYNPHAAGELTSSSSSGNAAALAARFCVIGLSSDTSGSTTAPASVSHIVGLRPYYNAFDMSGLFPIAGQTPKPRSDTIGVMALTVKDVCIVMDVLSKPNQTIDYNHWCGGSTVPQNPIRVGVVGNLTYGAVAVVPEYEYSIEYEVLLAFTEFEAKLRQLNNVSVALSWDGELVGPLEELKDISWSALYWCLILRLDRFLQEHAMNALPNGQRVRTVADLLDLQFNGSVSDDNPCENHDGFVWYCVLFPPARRNQTACDLAEESAREALAVAIEQLEETIFRKFDVVVFTQNPYQLVRVADISTGMPLGDVAGEFSYPAITVPIGLTEPSAVRPNAIPLGAYFAAPPRNFHLMMNLARRYEDAFWEPKMPADIDAPFGSDETRSGAGVDNRADRFAYYWPAATVVALVALQLC